MAGLTKQELCELLAVRAQTCPETALYTLDIIAQIYNLTPAQAWELSGMGSFPQHATILKARCSSDQGFMVLPAYDGEAIRKWFDAPENQSLIDYVRRNFQ